MSSKLLITFLLIINSSITAMEKQSVAELLQEASQLIEEIENAEESFQLSHPGKIDRNLIDQFRLRHSFDIRKKLNDLLKALKKNEKTANDQEKHQIDIIEENNFEWHKDYNVMIWQ